jgi:iron complex outermembrane receptor protein
VEAPLLKNTPIIGEMDFDLAYRFAQYSISGSAETWKIGANWQPLDELRIRGTLSRDFRAPNLYELFAGQSATFGLFNDAVHSRQNAELNTYFGGNPNLKPEIGNTSTVGVVWSPSGIEGLKASLDYYTIRITNQIAKLSSQVEDQICQSSGGTDPLCAYIVRPTPFSNMTAASFPTYIVDVPYNQASVSESGFDLDMTYRLELGTFLDAGPASLNFRFIGNYLSSLLQYTGIGGRVIQEAGGGNFPKIKVNFNANYIDGPINIGAGIRVIGPDSYSRDPTVFYQYNGGLEAGAVVYLDLNISRDFQVAGSDFAAYGAIKNVFNTYVFVPNSGLPYEFYPSNEALYDVVGRYFTVGLKFNT